MQIEIALEGMRAARSYTKELLATIPETDWLRFPPGVSTNVLWQVAHLAMAEYRLGLERIRGRRESDESFMPLAFLDQYGRGSVPSDDPAKNFSLSDVRRTLDAVHDQVLVESRNWTDADLQADALAPHRLFTKKIDALYWCSRHEMLHAGQIGLVRRMLGSPPVW